MFNVIIFKHCTLLSNNQSLLWNFSTVFPVKHLSYSICWEAVSFTFRVRESDFTFLLLSNFVCPSPDDIFVPILINENQLITIDLQFQKKLLAHV